MKSKTDLLSDVAMVGTGCFLEKEFDRIRALLYELVKKLPDDTSSPREIGYFVQRGGQVFRFPLIQLLGKVVDGDRIVGFETTQVKNG